ncbi:MAG: PhzF family phenazine biosynthesis protein [Prevotella sp.]|jgi:PhzF family phenazine biosynthesis protein|nr:PhzF family phenazine biosynthesis protein [Prevotella sp.]
MEKFIYQKLDAFSVGKSKGNPAACIYLKPDQQLSDHDMLNIAIEHKGFVSEVIFCKPISKDLYELRYFSSECEVEFCGHGTIACMYSLIASDTELKQTKEITIRTNRGSLAIYNKLSSLNAVFITAPDPEYLSVKIETKDISKNLEISPNEISTEYPVMLIDAGLKTLIVPITNLESILKLKPAESTLKDFCLNNGIDIILAFTTEVANKENKIRTRVFAPKFGYLEDPATGSGNSAMGYYMLQNGLWGGESISIEQNAELYDHNIVKLKTLNNKVLFGGSAITKIDGYYLL